MPQDGLLDHHKVLPRQDNSAGQAGVNTGDTGKSYITKATIYAASRT